MSRILSWSYRFLFGLCLFLPGLCGAQNHFHEEAFWKKIEPLDQPPAFGPVFPDSILLVVSNRQKDEGEIRFMSNRTSSSGISYFLVYAEQGKWKLFSLPNLEQGLTYFKDRDLDWLIYVEGMGKVFGHGLSRGFRVSGQYGLNLIYLDYPSTHGDWKGARNFFYARGQARRAHWDFLPAFMEIQNLRERGLMGKGKLTGFFHSMGNILLKTLGESPGLERINKKVWMDQLIINAPCVPVRNHCQWLSALEFAQNKIVVYNPGDYVLKGARLLSLRRQLGHSSGRKPCAQVRYINLESWAAQSHNNFLVSDQDPWLFPFYLTILHGGRAYEPEGKF